MAKYLIVNADDYGMCTAANEAVNDLFLTGNLKSSTIMLPCPTAKDACLFALFVNCPTVLGGRAT